MKRYLLVLGLIVLCLGIFYGPNIIRLNNVINLYNEDRIAHNFINMKDLFHHTDNIKASDNPYIFQKAMCELPGTYNNNGQEYNLVDALAHYSTDGLIVLKDGVMLYETYWNGNDVSSQHISWSVAKSFLSALVGIAIEDGLIESIDDPITKYLVKN